VLSGSNQIESNCNKGAKRDRAVPGASVRGRAFD
jgi:hypothetical protein